MAATPSRHVPRPSKIPHSAATGHRDKLRCAPLVVLCVVIVFIALIGCVVFVLRKSDPVSWDTELARMTVTKEAGHGNETEEVSDTAGAVESTRR
jgi:ABC-type phosphate transport system permease subunit